MCRRSNRHHRFESYHGMEVIFACGEASHVSFSSLIIVGLMLRLYRYQILPTCINYQIFTTFYDASTRQTNDCTKTNFQHFQLATNKTFCLYYGRWSICGTVYSVRGVCGVVSGSMDQSSRSQSIPSNDLAMRF